jgi:hypothetical protein
MAAIDQNCQLNASWAAMIEKGIERGTNGPPRVKYVIAEDHIASLYIATDGPRCDHGTSACCRQIIPVKLDVENSSIHRTFLDAPDEFSQSLRERHSAALDTDERQVFASIALFDDLMREPHQGSLNLGRGH